MKRLDNNRSIYTSVEQGSIGTIGFQLTVLVLRSTPLQEKGRVRLSHLVQQRGR